ncbi:RNA polymerase sigma factor [Pelagovum pacificum]|uniref:RNA polymerase sigma factor n=1 Tax=Pelagovum pacificum TaxID=2588711 RepID=A0A5C5GEB7_9RHOB|nr:RNA polymerase sigma factor [Pelagovum pacificum]QQA44519.1 RNA polymerase sigma factor [Pelagovum pacificum]TNY32367.1 RNA polymerase sigma factor [Pelagovum pacificum]
MTDAETTRAVETVFRMEQARLIAGLARMLRDVSRAEELAQDALVVAMTDWKKNGVPDNPGAWLMATAKRRAIDGLRRREMMARKHAEIAADLEDDQLRTSAFEEALDDDIGDELLGLIFTACHPILKREARAALTLRLIGGLSVSEIARAFLATEATIGQRITRAKRAIADAGLSFEVPRGADRDARLPSVLEVIYLIFNEGYAATSGEALIRFDLCAEAQRLGRILAGLMADEPEVWGLLALMELHASRLRARTGPDGAPIALPDQNRAAWDRLLIGRGLKALERAEALEPERGPYTLQGAIAACHARALTGAATDWERIAALYDDLWDQAGTPVIALNRAIALSMARGPEEGLLHLSDIEQAGVLPGYAPLPAARADCLFRLGHLPEARQAFELAATLTRNTGERTYLLKRAGACCQA